MLKHLCFKKYTDWRRGYIIHFFYVATINGRSFIYLWFQISFFTCISLCTTNDLRQHVIYFSLSLLMISYVGVNHLIAFEANLHFSIISLHVHSLLDCVVGSLSLPHLLNSKALFSTKGMMRAGDSNPQDLPKNDSKIFD